MWTVLSAVRLSVLKSAVLPLASATMPLNQLPVVPQSPPLVVCVQVPLAAQRLGVSIKSPHTSRFLRRLFIVIAETRAEVKRGKFRN